MKRFTPALLLFAFAHGTLQAEVIYDNQATVQSGVGSDIDASSYVADDFVLLPGASTITGVQWTGTYWNSDTPTAATDDFTIQIFSDNSGQPGTLLYNLAIGNPGRTDTGIDIFIFQTTRNLYSYTATIAPITLTASVPYWLSILNDTSADTNDNWDWSIETSGGGNAAFRNSPLAAWNTTPYATDFQLIPEPATLALLGVGLGAFGIARRGRRSPHSGPLGRPGVSHGSSHVPRMPERIPSRLRPDGEPVRLLADRNLLHGAALRVEHVHDVVVAAR